MDTLLRAETAIIHAELTERRERLDAARATLQDSGELTRLLREVDSALDRIADGTFGICDTCHEPIEPDRLMTDPLVRNCIGHLNATEQLRLERDLDLAGRIQQVLLPKHQLSFDGWDTCYHYEPMGPASGDYCDVVTSNDGELLFFLGDIAGKGVAASFLMSHLHAIMRSLVSLRLPFDQLIDRANSIFCESVGGRHFATLVCGRALTNGDIELSNAGHCPPQLVRGGESIEIPANGLPIGMFCTAPYTVTRVSLARGDSLVLYTDGVTESEDQRGEEYGPARLASALVTHARKAATELLSSCLADLVAFRAGGRASDDVTMLVIRRTR